MKPKVCLAALTCATMVLSGCSTRPREFSPTLAPPTSTAAAAQETFNKCRTLALGGVRSGFAGRVASGAGGAAVGIGVSAAVAPAVFGAVTPGFLGTNAFAAGVSAGAASLLVVGPLVGFGISRAIRSGREKKLKAAMATCMTEFGYEVDGWNKSKRPKKRDPQIIPVTLVAAPVAGQAAPVTLAPVTSPAVGQGADIPPVSQNP